MNDRDMITNIYKWPHIVLPLKAPAKGVQGGGGWPRTAVVIGVEGDQIEIIRDANIFDSGSLRKPSEVIHIDKLLAEGWKVD